MTRKSLIFALIVLAGIFGFRALFPETAHEVAEKGREVFEGDIDYRQVLTEIGSSVPAFLSSDAEEDGDIAVISEISADSSSDGEIEHAAVSFAELTPERGTNAGELSAAADTELPPAVAAFLERQAEYEDMELPEDVDYSYTEFPYESCVPVLGYNSSGFGYRTHPIHGDVRFHYGTDFAAWSGEDIYAFAGGEVTFAGWCESYGNYITIEHPGGWESLYAHCSILYVETGDQVEAGDKIALVGATGQVTGPHLHFELMRDGIYTNPEYYVN